MEDTPHYIEFDNVNIDIWHQDQDWLARWRKVTGFEEGSPDGMDDEDPFVVTRISSESPTPESDDNYLGASIVIPRGSKIAQG